MPCYIFDVDDTLVRYENFDPVEWYRFIAEPVARKHGVPLDYHTWNDMISGKISRRYTEKFGLSAIEFWREVDSLNLKYRKFMLKNGRLSAYSDAYSISKLQGKKCAWSASSEDCIKFVLSTFNLLNYFDLVIGKDFENYAYIDHMKPDPKFLKIIKEKLGCRDCVVIGDGEKELKAARDAGCIAVLVSRNGKRSRYANLTIKSLDELLDKNFL